MSVKIRHSAQFLIFLYISLSHTQHSQSTLQFCTDPCLTLTTLSPHSTVLYISLSHTQHSQSTLQFCTYPCLTLSTLIPHSTIINPHIFLTLTLLFLPASGRSVAVRLLHPHPLSENAKFKVFVVIVRNVLTWARIARNIWRPEPNIAVH
jgi:hypothetical protein